MSVNQYLHAPMAACEVLKITNDGETALTAGAIHVEGTLLGIVAEDIAVDGSNLLIIAVPAPGIDFPKATGLAITKGDALFYNSGGGNLNKTATNRFVGFAVADAATNATRVAVTFGPTYPYPAPA